MTEQNTSEINDFTLPTLIMTRAQLQVWVDNGWTKPGTPGVITTILLQFYSSDVAKISSDMQLVAYPRQANGIVYVDGQTILAIDSTKEPLLITGAAIFANNQIGIASLGILNEDGSLNNFEYLQFTPERYPKNPEYINYIVVVVRTEQRAEAGAEAETTWPCPPYCNPL
jgi:hypothetical protein